MSNTTTFTDILNTPAEQVEAPKPIPAGAWLALVDGPHENIESSQKKTPGIRFKLKLLQAHGDIDGPDAEIQKAIGRTVQNNTYFSENNLDLAKHQLKQFLLACGIDDRNKTLNEMMSEAPGQQVIVTIKHRMTQPTDGSEPQTLSEVDKFAKA